MKQRTGLSILTLLIRRKGCAWFSIVLLNILNLGLVEIRYMKEIALISFVASRFFKIEMANLHILKKMVSFLFLDNWRIILDIFILVLGSI